MTICHQQATCDVPRFRFDNGADLGRYPTVPARLNRCTNDRGITGPVPPSSEGGTRSGGPAGGDVSSWHDRGRDACRVPLA
jgi:hypothetical protein